MEVNKIFKAKFLLRHEELIRLPVGHIVKIVKENLIGSLLDCIFKENILNIKEDIDFLTDSKCYSTEIVLLNREEYIDLLKCKERLKYYEN